MPYICAAESHRGGLPIAIARTIELRINWLVLTPPLPGSQFPGKTGHIWIQNKSEVLVLISRGRGGGVISLFASIHVIYFHFGRQEWLPRTVKKQSLIRTLNTSCSH